eukprot:403365396
MASQVLNIQGQHLTRYEEKQQKSQESFHSNLSSKSNKQKTKESNTSVNINNESLLVMNDYSYFDDRSFIQLQNYNDNTNFSHKNQSQIKRDNDKKLSQESQLHNEYENENIYITDENLQTFENIENPPQNYTSQNDYNTVAQNFNSNSYLNNNSAQPLSQKHKKLVNQVYRKNNNQNNDDMQNGNDILHDFIYTEYEQAMLNYKQKQIESENLGVVVISCSPEKQTIEAMNPLSSQGNNIYLNDQIDQSLSKKDKLILSILRVSLEAYNVDEKITPEKAFSYMNKDQIEILGQNIDKSLLNKIQSQLSPQKKRMNFQDDQDSLYLFDFGHYPLIPWLNESTKQNPNQRTQELLKYEYFHPPADREDLYVLLPRECSSRFTFPFDRELISILNKVDIDVESLQESVMRVNSILQPFKKLQKYYERFIMFYVLLGILIATISIICGIINKTKDFPKIIHFNLSLALRNENDNYLSKFGIKARPGYLSKWIEFHVVKQNYSENMHSKSQNKKRNQKQHYKKQFQSFKKSEELQKGITGFLVTCDQYKEQRCVKEIFNILNDQVEKLYPELDIEGIMKQCEEKRWKAKEEKKRLLNLAKDQNGQNGLSVDEQIREEINQMKRERMFFIFETGTAGVVFIKLLDDFRPYIDIYTSGFIMQSWKFDEFKLLAEPVIKKYFPHLKENEELTEANYRTWCLEFKKKNNESIDKAQYLDFLFNSIDGKKNPVDLRHADYSVIIEIYRDVLAFAVVPQYKELKKCNLQQLVKGEGEGQDADSDDDEQKKAIGAPIQRKVVKISDLLLKKRQREEQEIRDQIEGNVNADKDINQQVQEDVNQEIPKEIKQEVIQQQIVHESSSESDNDEDNEPALL